MLKIKNGFTLAEVLITLSIIGVVAALTIPTVVKDYQDNVNIIKAKKTYSELVQAWKLYCIESGGSPVGTFRGGTPQEPTEFKERFLMKYIKTSKNILYSDGKILGVRYLNAPDAVNYDVRTGIVKPDGVFIGIYSANGDCPEASTGSGRHSCAFLVIDVNGIDKGPSILGHDLFQIHLMANSVHPYEVNSALPYDPRNESDAIVSNRCLKYDPANPDSTKSNNRGYGCLKRALENKSRWGAS